MVIVSMPLTRRGRCICFRYRLDLHLRFIYPCYACRYDNDCHRRGLLMILSSRCRVISHGFFTTLIYIPRSLMSFHARAEWSRRTCIVCAVGFAKLMLLCLIDDDDWHGSIMLIRSRRRRNRARDSGSISKVLSFSSSVWAISFVRDIL